MNKKVLAASIGAVLTVSFLAPSIMNAQAQVSSESRVLNTILALTNDINKKAQTLNNNLDNIDDDLLLKQKFYTLTVTGAGDELDIEAVCDFDDPSACAYNIEGIQCYDGEVLVDEIEVGNDEDVKTDLSDKEIETPANILVEMGVGKIGVSGGLEFDLEFDPEFNGTCVVVGEKPQGMRLEAHLQD
jgi:hypothetical protein